MRPLSKKGEENSMNLLYEILAFVLVLIALLAVFFLLADRGEDSTQDILCRSSVVIRSKATLSIADGIVDFEKITPLACHTKDLGNLGKDREEVKSEIAKYSAMCWWQFAEGSVPDIFKADKKEKACFVCYTFTIDNKIDKGVQSRIQGFNEPLVQDRSLISSSEMTNFLLSETYDPALIYGGGTKNYFGDSYIYDADVGISADARTMSASKIKSTSVNGYISDYSYMITEKTKEEINKIGAEPQINDAGNIFVVVAEDFKSMENSDAREIIENIKLNSNDTNYDAILIMLDLKDKTIKVHLGSDHSVFIKDYEIKDILEDSFKDIGNKCSKDNKCNLEEVNNALAASVTKISDKLLNKQTIQGLSPKSYYYYLTNGGYTWTMISDIDSNQRYAITYVSTSDETGWPSMKQMATGGVIGGAIGGAIVGAILTVTGIGAPVGVPMLVTAGAAIGLGANYAVGSALNVDQPDVKPNNIMIVPVNNIGDVCTIVE